MIDVLTILIFGGIAVFFGFKLFTVLGRHEGHMEAPTSDNRNPAGLDRGPAQPNLRPAFEGPAAAGLEAIAAADSRFDPNEFVEGAKAAYRMIVEAFAAGDRDRLSGLLASAVFDRYERAINDRESRGETVKSEIDRIKSADITEAEHRSGTARVKVRFEAEIATETLDKDGNRVSGDLANLAKTVEYWTFERKTTSSDPNWELSSVSVA